MSEYVAKRRMTAADLWSLPRVGLPVPAPNPACDVLALSPKAWKQALQNVEASPPTAAAS